MAGASSAGFTGSLCGGGSAANLMGLAMAREARLPANETGIRGGVIYASEQVHMVALLGIGRANLRLELELLASVPLSAVCFRHRAKDNRAILRRVIARGRVYLSNATIGNQFALRACFVNHRTTDDDVLEIVSEVIAAAGELND